MRINQNIMAFNAFRNLSQTQNELAGSLEKLSSGFRINRAADDAAGLVKSESLRTEIGGSEQAVRNAQDGVSFVQTAEGAADEVHAMLQRMYDLAVSAANDGTSDGSAEQAEVEELLAEIDSVGSRTTFAGNDVFQDYSTTALTFHIGPSQGQTLEISDDLQLSSAQVFTDSGGTAVDLSAIDLEADPDAAMGDIEGAIDAVSDVRSTLGATQNRLESTIRNLSVAVENLSAAESRIRDTDMAEEMVSFTRHQILQQAGTSMLAQANQVPSSVLALLQ